MIWGFFGLLVGVAIGIVVSALMHMAAWGDSDRPDGRL